MYGEGYTREAAVTGQRVMNVSHQQASVFVWSPSFRGLYESLWLALMTTPEGPGALLARNLSARLTKKAVTRCNDVTLLLPEMPDHSN